MPLTYASIKNAKPAEKEFKLFDGGGLFLLVTPEGGKYWRWAYRFDSKQQTMALGVYPAVSLVDARKKMNELKVGLRNGIDPKTKTKKAIKSLKNGPDEDKFGSIARSFYLKKSPIWTLKHSNQWLKNMEVYAFPVIGEKLINTITQADILKIAETMGAKKIFETRDRLLQSISAVFRYAIALQKVDKNPANDIKIVLEPKPSTKHFSCIGKEELPAFLKKFTDYEKRDKTTSIAISAFKLLMYTATRTSEVRFSKWENIDLTNALWTIPAEQTGRKGRKDKREAHTVPLSSQVVELLKKLNVLTGHQEYLFPNRITAGKTISENTILKIIELIGYQGKMTGHGFRSLCRTIMDEKGYRFQVLESILSHKVGDKTVTSYARSNYLEERKEIMQLWADYLDQIAVKDESR